MKCNTSIICSIAVVVGLSLSASRSDPTIDSEAEVRHVLSKLGCIVQNNSISKQSHILGGIAMASYHFEIEGIGSSSATSNEAQGNFTISTNREWDKIRGVGRTGAKKWASESVARQYVLSKLREIAGNQPGSIVQFKYALDSQNSQGKVVLGVLEALFQFTFDGYPTVDRYCGYIVKLDPQDGKLISFRSGPRPPPRGSAGTPISVASARARASAVYPRANMAAMRAHLGWAVPPGGGNAVLTYVLQNSNSITAGAGAILVEAKQNGRVWYTGPSAGGA